MSIIQDIESILKVPLPNDCKFRFSLNEIVANDS